MAWQRGQLPTLKTHVPQVVLKPLFTRQPGSVSCQFLFPDYSRLPPSRALGLAASGMRAAPAGHKWPVALITAPQHFHPSASSLLYPAVSILPQPPRSVFSSLLSLPRSPGVGWAPCLSFGRFPLQHFVPTTALLILPGPSWQAFPNHTSTRALSLLPHCLFSRPLERAPSCPRTPGLLIAFPVPSRNQSQQLPA